MALKFHILLQAVEKKKTELNYKLDYQWNCIYSSAFGGVQLVWIQFSFEISCLSKAKGPNMPFSKALAQRNPSNFLQDHYAIKFAF